MKTCTDCIHYYICMGAYGITALCNSFKDQSRFIELPCSVGDKLYDVRMDNPYVRTGIVRDIEVAAIDVSFVPWETWAARDVHLYDLGHTVFLTQEEANKKLEELKHEKERT